MKPKSVPASINELIIDRHLLRDAITQDALPDTTISSLRDAAQDARQTAERAGTL